MHRPRNKSHRPRYLLAALLVLGGASCGSDVAEAERQAATGGDCIDSGKLTGRIYGAIEGELDWRGAELGCDGMPRPDSRGARLRFSGSLDTGAEVLDLALIIALPELEQGETAVETPARVTLIEEDGGRFFSTGELDACWSDVTRQEPVTDRRFAVGGIVYCMSPLAELNGSSGVSFTELAFAGRVDWAAP